MSTRLLFPVTNSALLDLVSAEWLERLVVEAAVHKLPLYAALSYDGGVVLVPEDAFDAEIVSAVNRHQLKIDERADLIFHRDLRVDPVQL